MGIYDVGVENLPNVYIDSAIVERHRISVRCLIKDDKRVKTWRGRQELAELSVKALLVHDSTTEETLNTFTNITLKLNSGEDSLHSYKTSDDQKYFVETAMASEFTKLHTDLSMTAQEDFYFKTFNFRHSLGFPYVENANNVTVYAACFLDNLSFDNEIFNKFYGPMVSERIIISKAANSQSGYFYNPETNEEYGGPVHEHNGEYMVGSYHVDTPHSSLRYVVEPNNKITVEF